MTESLASCYEISINAALVVMKRMRTRKKQLLEVFALQPTGFWQKKQKNTHVAFDWSANVDTNSTGPLRKQTCDVNPKNFHQTNGKLHKKLVFLLKSPLLNHRPPTGGPQFV